MTTNNNSNFRKLQAIAITDSTYNDGTTQIWVRYENGQEQQITLKGEVPIRASHRLALLVYKDNFASFYNRATKQFARIATAQELVGPKAINLWTYLKFIPFILGFAYLGATNANSTKAKIIVIGIGVVIFGVPAWIQTYVDHKHKKAIKDLDVLLSQETAFLPGE